MFKAIARNAIFILFPVLLAAIGFLARINLQAAQSFGKWGEKSIVESTFLLAAEKVDRVEQDIISTDNLMFDMISPKKALSACLAWQTGIKSEMIDSAAIIDDEGELIQFFYRQTGRKEIQKSYKLMVDKFIPIINFYESFDQIKHYHIKVNGSYYLLSSYTTEYENHIYTVILKFNIDEILGQFFENIIEDVGKDRVVNVVDDDSRIIFGDSFRKAGDFSVAKRFPSTLYKWKLQIAPISAALFTHKAKRVKISSWILIPASFGIIIFGIFVLIMVWVRERRLNVLKSDFIANTSHELKTPLALIKMFAELLAMKQVKDPERIAKYHSIILRETERLTALIDNVLDFARIERGRSVYRFEKIDPAVTVTATIDVYRHRVEAMGAKLTLKIADDLPSIVADEDAITLVLLNLVDNAIKYAVGTDVIGVELYGRGKYVFLDVYDRGNGIPVAHLKRIFDRFYRYKSKNGDSNKQRGSGIGLSLVKHIAKAHGGYATVTSTPGVETRFSVRFSTAK